jgi:guanylate kinase
MNNERYLLVVSGPSGIGKDTVVKNLMDRHAGIELSVSATTRPPRGYEVDGEHYFFLPRRAFLRRVENGEFVEYTNYAGNYYGTLKSEVAKRITQGVTCVLVIEVNGSAAVKAMYPECTTVFVVAPGMAEHERRLRSRGSESEEVMAERMRIAEREMKMAGEYDFQLVNGDALACSEELYRILKMRQTG